jgi:hypothetical protein
MISERAFAKFFNSFWNELLPLLTPTFMAQFNAGYELVLLDASEKKHQFIPVGEGVERPDIVAEFAFRLAKYIYIERIPSHGLLTNMSCLAIAEKEAFELISKYEGGRPEEVLRLSTHERDEGLLLCARYQSLYDFFSCDHPVEYCPTFPGAGFLNSTEGDIGVGNCLVEVKTTTRKPTGRDLRQLITYAALDANAGRNRWTHFGLFNPRRGTLHHANIDALLLRLSGGKASSDVYADLIAFLESYHPAQDHKF